MTHAEALAQDPKRLDKDRLMGFYDYLESEIREVQRDPHAEPLMLDRLTSKKLETRKAILLRLR